MVSILDQLDARVEKLRKEALKLQENKDFLLMSVDLLKNNEHFGTINDRMYINYIQKLSNKRNLLINFRRERRIKLLPTTCK